MATANMPVLTPRDTAALTHLKGHGLNLIEVKITEFSPALGKRLDGVLSREGSRVVSVVRNGRTMKDLDAVFLEEGDVVYLVTNDEASVRQYFTVFY